MPVTDQHKEYEKNAPLWALVGDCVEGAAAIKKGAQKYLPKPNPEDTGSENAARYSAYVERASFVNFTDHTKAGLMGLVFSKPAVKEFPEPVQYAIDDANGAGLSLEQLTRDAIGETLEAGRYGLLVDYPDAPAGLSVADTAALNLRANILPYKPKSIVNWRSGRVGGVSMLTLVVLAEDIEKVGDDGFSVECKTYYRVLVLEDGVYKQRLYNEKNELVDLGNGETEIIPRNAQGEPWQEIPFTFIGSENNDPTVDKSPLLDIANVNIAHYRNSADYEESCFMVGQPTPYVAGLTASWAKEILKGGVILGSRTAWVLPTGASAGLLQASPNQMPLEGMKEKEGQLIKIGAKIITDASGQETAEGAKIRFAGSTSQLGLIVSNVESAIIKALNWAAEFMGGQGEIKYTLNRQFYDATLDPNMIVAGIQLLDRAVIARSDMQALLRRAGMVRDNRTDEEIDAEAEVANPLA